MKLSYRRVSRKAVQQLLQDPGWSIDANLTSHFAPYKVYLHPDDDGQALLIFTDGAGRLYLQDDFTIVINLSKSIKSGEKHHVLEGRLPQGQAFVESVPMLVEELAQLLKLPREGLDRSFESLEAIDRKVKHVGRAQCLKPPVFPALVAYIGEVMRHQTQGKWEMRFDQEQAIWEPWIVDATGNWCNPFLAVYDELVEQSPMSIAGATRGRIHSRHPLITGSNQPLAKYSKPSDTPE